MSSASDLLFEARLSHHILLYSVEVGLDYDIPQGTILSGGTKRSMGPVQFQAVGGGVRKQLLDEALNCWGDIHDVFRETSDSEIVSPGPVLEVVYPGQGSVQSILEDLYVGSILVGS